ncbi:glycoside hydrolase family 13 protein [Neobacillus cucumis]|uniref:glycoside hydrolase family 13 protein n=1 Tax=Neobacillus cucumis TaxID=1740721 RepID=UPI00285325B6|nr:alpha-glucosidase [Neobacillus cucumis]MDR4950330.1 alpha-glucosidase [Neobacillus cucumis]
MKRQQWWMKSVVYQIYPKSFYDSNNDGVGDLKGVIQKLDYLKELGIDVIWLSPVYESPMDDNGYDISDYQAIAEEFGSMEDMEQLISEAAKRDIKIIMDLVVNHTSDEHSWFLKSKREINHPKRDWYIWRNGKADGTPPNNWRSIFGGSSWEYDEQTNQFYLHVFSKKQPDLNWENPEVRDAVYNMIRWWLDKGISGFRVDAITFIKKRQNFGDVGIDSNDNLGPISEASLNQDGIDQFLSELNEKAFAPYDILTVAEAPGVSPKDLPKYVGENGYFSMLFEFDHVDLDLGKEGKWYKPNNWSLIQFKEAITTSQNIYNEVGWGALYLENHDQPRSLNKFIKQNDISLIPAKMLATVYFFLKGTPFIYQGQEIGMTNVAYPTIDEYNDLASIDQYHSALREGYSKEEALAAVWKRSRDNARTPMQWNDSKNAGFTKSEPWLKVNTNYPSINVEHSLKNNDSLFYFYKELIRLRKNSEYSHVVVLGKYEALLESHPQIIAYTRALNDQKIVIIANFEGKEVTIGLDLHVKKVILSNYKNVPTRLNNFTLRPYEAMVYEIES